ncbi:hypothetical protein TWF694_003985 [Orbilia ellipsospora]|uniref:Myb-like DNA-binding domain-containing protein n=1 Tax=Orbilia ellipsospora TaxID=2528407 RepID=A0AAV9WXW1_9PEZI
MPAKLTHTQEASFLLDIIKHSDLKSINWQAIADKKQIKKGAAQMRYQRLKQAIEKAEAGESGIASQDGPRSDSEQSLQSPISQSVPTTPKKPRANKIEKPKTPSSGRKKKAPVPPPQSMQSSMMSTTSVESMSMQSVSPAPAPMIKMEMQEYPQLHQMPTVAPSFRMAPQAMAGMPC